MNKLEALRMQVRALEGHHLETPEDGLALPFADARLNAPLPRGGLRLDALHEFTAPGLEGELAPAVTGFAATVAASILRSRGGALLWASSRSDCYPPGLARFGLEASRIVWVDCRKDAEVLGVMEEALRSRALSAVIGEAGALTLKTGLRLDAAARLTGATALLVRRHMAKPLSVSEAPSGAAATRWRVSTVLSSYAPSPCPSPGELVLASSRLNVAASASGCGGGEGTTWKRARPAPLSHPLADADFRSGNLAKPRLRGRGDGGEGDVQRKAFKCLGPPRWRLDLDYCRNGRTASWIVEALEESDGEGFQAGHVRVVAELCNDARASEAAPARAPKRTARAS
jgi:protein ImuA